MLLNNLGTWPPNPLRAYAAVRIVPGDEIVNPLPYFVANYANAFSAVAFVDVGVYDLTLSPRLQQVRDTRWGVLVSSEFLTGEGTTETSISYQWQSSTVLRVSISDAPGVNNVDAPFTVALLLGAWQAIIPAPPNPPVPPPPLP